MSAPNNPDPLPPDPHAVSSEGVRPRFEALSLTDLRRAAEARTPWLWRGYLAPGNVTLLTSQWKAGKTTLMATLLARMGAGIVIAELDAVNARRTADEVAKLGRPSLALATDVTRAGFAA